MGRAFKAFCAALLLISCLSGCGRGDFIETSTAAPSVTTTETSRSGEKTKVVSIKTINIAENARDNFFILGRSYVRNGGLVCDFTCTGISFNVYCSGDVEMQITTSNDTYFTVYLNGERMEERLKVSSGDKGKWITVLSGLEAGKKEIRLVKQSQFTMAATELNFLRFNGYFLSTPEPCEMFIEFYGDSILNGSNIHLGGTSASTSDGTLAFGYLAAQMLGADCNIIGCGGLGLSAPLEIKSGVNVVMEDIYDLCGSLTVSGVPKYDFQRIPDLVVIELGCNDEVRSNLTTAGDYRKAVKKMIENLREKYGEDVPIVWLFGYHEKIYRINTETALKSLGGETANIYMCELSKSYIPKENGGDGYHPDVNTTKIMAEELVVFLKAKKIV